MNVMDIYNRLAPLHKDTEAFTEEANRVRQEILESVPEEQRQRAAAIMWRREQELSRIKNTTARMERAYQLLIEDLQKLNEALKDFRRKV